MSKKLLKDSKGFTIIEVLIVLAIAGLIMLVVFLAIPALQRNQRNSARNSDVGRVVGSMSEWYANNNAAVFVAGTGNANLQQVIDASGTLTQYTLVPASAVGANSLTVTTGAQTPLTGGTNNVNLGSMQIVTGARCGTGGATVADSSTRRTAIQYLVETQSGVTPICREV